MNTFYNFIIHRVNIKEIPICVLPTISTIKKASKRKYFRFQRRAIIADGYDRISLVIQRTRPASFLSSLLSAIGESVAPHADDLHRPKTAETSRISHPAEPTMLYCLQFVSDCRCVGGVAFVVFIRILDAFCLHIFRKF